jgi:hypothetical protein
MYFSSSLVVLAALVASTQAFMGYTPVLTNTPKSSLSSSSSSSPSTLNMVADDAKVCLVTGSSRGLGKAIALNLGKAGQKVIINFVSDSSKDSADATVAEIKALGGDAVAIQADSK